MQHVPLGSGPPRREFPFVPGEMPPLFGDTAAALVVDDNAATVQMLSSILTYEGYECTGATSAAEARAVLAERDIAIALVDVMMPGESGLEFVAQVLTDHPFLAVVMVTGIDDPAIADLALQSGAYGYLVKPFEMNEVIISVNNAGRRRCLEIESAVYRRRLEMRLDEQSADLDEALRQIKELYESRD